MSWWNRSHAGDAVNLRADWLHGWPAERSSPQSSHVDGELDRPIGTHAKIRERLGYDSTGFGSQLRICKRAGCSVAEVTHEKKELESVQTKMENPCVNSGSQEVNGIDNGRVDRRGRP